MLFKTHDSIDSLEKAAKITSFPVACIAGFNIGSEVSKLIDNKKKAFVVAGSLSISVAMGITAVIDRTVDILHARIELTDSIDKVTRLHLLGMDVDGARYVKRNLRRCLNIWYLPLDARKKVKAYINDVLDPIIGSASDEDADDEDFNIDDLFADEDPADETNPADGADEPSDETTSDEPEDLDDPDGSDDSKDEAKTDSDTESKTATASEAEDAPAPTEDIPEQTKA